MTEKQYLSVTEAASLMSVTKRTVYRWLEEGRLPSSFMIPGRGAGNGEYRILQSELEAIRANPRTLARRCQATKANGQRCKAPAMLESDFCRWHQKEAQ